MGGLAGQGRERLLLVAFPHFPPLPPMQLFFLVQQPQQILYRLLILHFVA